MDAVTILGGGGHGLDILHDLRAQGVRVAGVYDNSPNRGPLGTTDDWYLDSRRWLVGVNDPLVRRDIASGRTGAYNDGIWVHRHADIGPSVDLGQHTHINAGVTVTRSVLGAFCTVSPGAHICGDVTIGHWVAIGAGATISHYATIGNGVVIGAGAVVLPHQHIDSGTWVGVPAEPSA